MHDPDVRADADSAPTALDRRGADREPLAGPVVVRLTRPAIEGRGRNVSAGGVHVVTAELPRVTVTLPDGSERQGELVRLENLGSGEAGLAVRFVDADA